MTSADKPMFESAEAVAAAVSDLLRDRARRASDWMNWRIDGTADVYEYPSIDPEGRRDLAAVAAALTVVLPTQEFFSTAELEGFLDGFTAAAVLLSANVQIIPAE